LLGGTSEGLTVQSTFPVGFDPGGNNGQGAPILGTSNSTATIDLPLVHIDRIQTYVLVPDGGTILVGGMGEYVEQSMSTKVPALGHIPFIGRLFGQRGRYSDRMKLSFLMTVNIIPYDEWEQRL
jgi:type II secretory pathway component GspD/PulD (secretin)